MIIAIDMGGTKIHGGLVQNGQVSNEVYVVYDKEKPLGSLYEVIDGLLEESVTEICLGVPTMVDDQGVLYETKNIPIWQKFHLKETLEEKYKKPVHVDNDVNCFVAGQLETSAEGAQNVIGITLGTGVGAGIVLNGKLHRGFSGAAGEIGNAPYLDADVEEYCSGKFFVNHFDCKGEDLPEDKKKEAYEQYGVHVGKAIAIAANLFSPDVIVIGGSIAKVHEHFEESMMNAYKESTFKIVHNYVKIVFAKESTNALLGVASLAKID